MSRAQSFGRTRGRLAALAGILGLGLLTGCAYEDGYYDPYPSYGYGYGYGGYGYYYPYGSPCWPYGCDDWNHRHHHRHDWGDDDNNHHHHGGGDVPHRDPPVRPGRQANDVPGPRDRAGVMQPPSSPYPLLIPKQRDSRR